MFPVPAATDDSQRDFELPQREAAFFYGLFLRGHSAEELRRDIEVPPAVLAKWHREAEREPGLRSVFERIVEYRRHVLAIFEALVGYDARSEEHTSELQSPCNLVCRLLLEKKKKQLTYDSCAF